jgi:hypothetical protein
MSANGSQDGPSGRARDEPTPETLAAGRHHAGATVLSVLEHVHAYRVAAGPGDRAQAADAMARDATELCRRLARTVRAVASLGGPDDTRISELLQTIEAHTP